MLKRNVLLPVERETFLAELFPELTEVLYVNARDEYMTGRYPVLREEALRLAGLQMIIDHGAFRSVEDAHELIWLISSNFKLIFVEWVRF